MYIQFFELSQADIAEELGISKFVLTRFLNGQSIPKPDALEKLFDWCMEVKQAVRTEPVKYIYVDRVSQLDIDAKTNGKSLSLSISSADLPRKARHRRGDKPKKYVSPDE
jgi:transcriptional regulator with XRE-family HTH domain